MFASSSRPASLAGRLGHQAHRAARAAQALIIAGTLAACGSVPLGPASPPSPALPGGSPSRPAVAAAPAVSVAAARPDGAVVWDRSKSRWVSARFDELPGWSLDRVSEAWAPLWRSCQRPPADWQALCAAVRVQGAAWGKDAGDEAVRRWLQARMQPWRIEALDGQTTGLLTGYFEPLIEGRRQNVGNFQTPLHSLPANLGSRSPYFSRAELETLPEARAAVAGRELVYVADPLDALLVQVQGSTRLRLLDEFTPQGQPKVVRLAFAGHNDQPYQSVARWLVDQGAITLEQASWPAIKAWASQNPQRVPEMLRANPRVVFFREEPLLNPEVGPVGAQGLPLTPGRSIAVDKDALPYGSLVWLDSTEPQAWAPTPPTPRPLQRLVLAQDTGGAIVGAVRADFFWGWGDEALANAGRTKQPLAMWVLWPRGAQPKALPMP